MSLAEYEVWILNECIPGFAARGDMAPERLVADFLNNEGRVDKWPDFGAVTDKHIA